MTAMQSARPHTQHLESCCHITILVHRHCAVAVRPSKEAFGITLTHSCQQQVVYDQHFYQIASLSQLHKTSKVVASASCQAWQTEMLPQSVRMNIIADAQHWICLQMLDSDITCGDSTRDAANTTLVFHLPCCASLQKRYAEWVEPILSGQRLTGCAGSDNNDCCPCEPMSAQTLCQLELQAHWPACLRASGLLLTQSGSQHEWRFQQSVPRPEWQLATCPCRLTLGPHALRFCPQQLQVGLQHLQSRFQGAHQHQLWGQADPVCDLVVIGLLYMG